MRDRLCTETVGSPGLLTLRASGPAFFAADEDFPKPERVPWSHPCRGITGDLGGPLFECID